METLDLPILLVAFTLHETILLPLRTTAIYEASIHFISSNTMSSAFVSASMPEAVPIS